MARFKQQYTESDFLEVLKGDCKTVGYIAKLIGCARSTAVLYLDKLKGEGKVIKISVDDGALFVWKIVKE